MQSKRTNRCCVPVTILILVFVLFTCQIELHAQSILNQEKSVVKIWEEKITLPTYQVGDPDENPLFYTPAEYQGAQRHIYPYAFRGELTNEKVDVDYQAVFLENEYVKICVTPEMGGRLYYAVDKTNDYNIVYYNKVVKPALIGMAGAWTSGGAEWNIPHHHRPTSFLPVDYKLVENSDGSKTVWVGEYEKRDQTRWLVGLTLEPGKAYIKTEFKYLNVTPVQNTFLFWANTAVHANKDYQVIFPPDVEKAVFHAKTEFTNWPIANQEYQGIDFTDGQDISWWKNTSSPTSFFAWETKQDFIAGIDHGKQAGTVKIGDRFIFPGKKFWNWGPNEVGQRWDEKLTDTDGPYLELMMGAYSDNQPDYSFINPMSTKGGTMYYYGIKNMDNIKEANADFAINLEQERNNAKIQINATGVNKDLVVLLTGNNENLLEETVGIDPFNPYSKKVKLPVNTSLQDLTIQLISGEGKELASWTPAPKKNEPHPEPFEDPLNPEDYVTNDELWLAGLRLEQFGNANFDAEKYYREALKRNPEDILVNTQLGLRYLKKGMNEQAEKYLRIAADQVTNNYTNPKYNEPLYYLGLSLKKQNKYEEAREILYRAAWDYQWASPAYTLLGQIEALRGDLKRAAENAEKATRANPSNIEAQNLKTMVLRKTSRYEEAFNVTETGLEVDPLNFNTMNEILLLSENIVTGKDKQEWLKLLKEKLRNETDNYLEVAARYGDAGFYDDAVNFLKHAADSEDKGISKDPMINYHLAYYFKLNGDLENALAKGQMASQQPIELVFPYGETSLNALQAAIELNKDDANAHYLMGNIYASHQPQRAVQSWKKAIALEGDKAIFYRNLAFAQANYTNEIEEAVDNIMRAVQLDASEPRYFAEAAEYMAYARLDPERIASFIEEYGGGSENDLAVKTTEIRLNNFFGNYNKSIEMLENTHFRTEEGTDFNIHVYWFDAHLLRGIEHMEAGRHQEAERDFLKAMEFPANLESERNSKIGISYYFLGLNSKLNNKNSRAEKYFKEMATYSYRGGWGAGSFPEIDFYKGLALIELKKPEEANILFEELDKSGERGLLSEENGQYSKSSIEHSGRVAPSFARRKATDEAHANALYKKGLALLGKGNMEEADEMFLETLKRNRLHLGAKTHLNEVHRGVGFGDILNRKK